MPTELRTAIDAATMPTAISGNPSEPSDCSLPLALGWWPSRGLLYNKITKCII